MRISDWSSDVCSSDLTPEDAATAVVDTESADDDNDGVSNDKDQCPGSAAGAVDENGCPVSDSSASSDSTSSEDTVAPVSGDSGSADCRTPTAGEQVDENGCAVDAATPRSEERRVGERVCQYV